MRKTESISLQTLNPKYKFIVQIYVRCVYIFDDFCLIFATDFGQVYRYIKGSAKNETR